MNNEHPISDEVLELAQLALNKGEHWMAYNNSLYFIDKSDVYFSVQRMKRMILQIIISVTEITSMRFILILSLTFIKRFLMQKIQSLIQMPTASTIMKATILQMR